MPESMGAVRPAASMPPTELTTTTNGSRSTRLCASTAGTGLSLSTLAALLIVVLLTDIGVVVTDSLRSADPRVVERSVHVSAMPMAGARLNAVGDLLEPVTAPSPGNSVDDDRVAGPTPTEEARTSATSSPSMTTVPASTTTVVPPPPTRGQPAVAPDDPGTGDLLARAGAALASAVPEPWRADIPVQLELIHGFSSYAHTDGTIRVSRYHAGRTWERLRAVMSHEFGHMIAYRYGTGEYLGTPPAGWPTSGHNHAEAWADCVSRAFTGYALGSHGLQPCHGESFDWTVDFLAAGPSS